MEAGQPIPHVDAAFAKWVAGLRPLVTKGEEIRNLIGAMKGVSILIHMCQSLKDDHVVDDAIVVLHGLCTSPVATEELVVLGGLQVCVDILLDESRSAIVHDHMLLLLIRVIVTDDLKRSLMELGATPAIIRLCSCKSIGENTGEVINSIVKRSLILLAACACIDENVELFRNFGAQMIEPLLILCEEDFDNVVLALATELLDKLCVDKDEIKEVFVKLNAETALLRILSHATEPGPKEHAMSVLRMLCEDPTIRKGIIERGGLAPLVQATHYGETMMIRRNAGVVLAEISLSDAMAPQLESLEGGKVFSHLEKKK